MFIYIYIYTFRSPNLLQKPFVKNIDSHSHVSVHTVFTVLDTRTVFCRQYFSCLLGLV